MWLIVKYFIRCDLVDLLAGAAFGWFVILLLDLGPKVLLLKGLGMGGPSAWSIPIGPVRKAQPFLSLTIFKVSRLGITTMPTIFGRWKTWKLLVWGGLLR